MYIYILYVYIYISHDIMFHTIPVKQNSSLDPRNSPKKIPGFPAGLLHLEGASSLPQVEPNAETGFGKRCSVGGVCSRHHGCFNQWICLRENLQESPIFNGKIYGFL